MGDRVDDEACVAAVFSELKTIMNIPCS